MFFIANAMQELFALISLQFPLLWFDAAQLGRCTHKHTLDFNEVATLFLELKLLQNAQDFRTDADWCGLQNAFVRLMLNWISIIANAPLNQ